jgi:hypothetical protein
VRIISSILLIAFVLTGCYGYMPVQGTSVPAGSTVRARLSTPGEFRLTEISASNVDELSGEVIRADADTLALSAFWLRSRSGLEHLAAGETVAIPRTQVAEIEQRRISWVRTIGLASAASIAGALILGAITGYGNGGNGRDGGGQTK